MTLLSALGGLPEMVLGLAFSLGCALLLGFASLRLVLSLMTRGHNGMDDPSHVGSIIWLGAAVAGTNGPAAGGDRGSDHGPGSGPTSGPYVLPAAASFNRFTRNAEPDSVTVRRVVELPQVVAGRIAQGGLRDGWSGSSGDAA
jgi:hypothetical protein